MTVHPESIRQCIFYTGLSANLGGVRRGRIGIPEALGAAVDTGGVKSLGGQPNVQPISV
jgi:hypothetical protein